MIRNSDRKYLIGGYDVSQWVLSSSMPSASQRKPEFGGIPDTTRLKYELINTEFIFSRNAEISIFHGANIRDYDLEVQIVQGSTTITEWKGTIENIYDDTEKNTVSVIGISKFAQKLDYPALVSRGQQTPSTLIKQVLILYDIPYSESSFSQADSLHAGVTTVVIDPNLLDSDLNLMELLKQLCSAGYCRIFNLRGEMHIDVFNSDVPSVSLSLNDVDLMTNPKVSDLGRNGQGYKVDYVDGFITSDNYGESGQSLNFGASATVKVVDLSSALSIANRWELIDATNKRRYQFAIPHEKALLLDLNSFVSLTWEEGFIIDEVLEIMSIDTTDIKYAKMVGDTV